MAKHEMVLNCKRGIAHFRDFAGNLGVFGRGVQRLAQLPTPDDVTSRVSAVGAVQRNKQITTPRSHYKLCNFLCRPLRYTPSPSLRSSSSLSLLPYYDPSNPIEPHSNLLGPVFFKRLSLTLLDPSELYWVFYRKW